MRTALVIRHGSPSIPAAQGEELLNELLSRPGLPLVLPFELACEDGSTRDREAPFAALPGGPGLQAFLISLKAGGVGLNLVAAQYVFLLHSWWNPESLQSLGNLNPSRAGRTALTKTERAGAALLQVQPGQS